MDAIRILVLDRGHVIVARCPEPQQHALWLTVTDSRTIRRWGTTQGLAELVNGPTASTQLDAISPSVSVPVRAILMVLEVEQDKWESHLKVAPKASTTRLASSRSQTGATS